MLYRIILILPVFFTNKALISASEVCDQLNLLNDVEVNPFIDENRYIRLNISWGDPVENFTSFDLDIDTNCSALYGSRNIPVESHRLVVPDMERLKHPAEPLLHGCSYSFEFSTQIPNETCLLTQVVNYQIAECVEQICDCSVATSPFEYSFHRINQDDGTYEINFKKTDSIDDFTVAKVFNKIWITSMTVNQTVILIHPNQLEFDNTKDVVYLKLPNLILDQDYMVHIDLIADRCEYHSFFKLDRRNHVPTKKILVRQSIIYVVIVSVLLFILLLVMLKRNPKLPAKIKSYLPFRKTSINPPTGSTDLVMKMRKEVINTQYTPLEFMQNSSKLDYFEIPRNKIILRGELGGGAFGKVYKADVYDFNNSDYIQAAVKKPFENAPSTEISDFLDEIATMKKIVEHGGHQNVIKLLFCVTLEQPYIMVMELAPCGSLKSYLTGLRKQLEEKTKMEAIRRDQRHFFPDNMILEQFLPNQTADSEKLKYTHLIFNDYTGSTASTSESNSYVTPDSPQTPSTPGSVTETNLPIAKRKPKMRKNFDQTKLLPNCLGQYSPLTPNSNRSSGLPSVTETLLTSLETTPITPANLKAGEDVRPIITSEKLQNFALQIANGMAFLESLNITHRDLATRNILLNQEGVLKISDFGMARAGVYVNSIQKRQPLRWMAPEAIEKRTCNNKTDVWSFGVVLWEIGSLGAFPYKELSNDQVIAFVLQGKRLQRPESCTDQLYELMMRCWQTCPENRPQFADISRQLDVDNAKLYVDFGEPLSECDISTQSTENI